MRIAHINLAKGFRGGERQTILLIQALADKGIRQKLLIRRDSPILSYLDSISDLDVITFTKPYLKYCLKRINADLLHAHEAKAAQWAFSHYLCKRTPYLLTRRILKLPGNNFFTRGIYNHAQKIIAVSHAVATAVQQVFPMMDIPVIPSMCADLNVDLQKVAALRARYQGKCIVGHIGALVEHDKGQSYLIEAARYFQQTLPALHFLLIGGGPDEARFRILAKGLKNLELLGHQQDIGSYLTIFDIFTLPSLQEGLGSILLDALQQGKPVVASKVGGIPDIIRHEYNGLLIPPADTNAICSAITRLYQDAILRNQLAENAHKSAAQYHPEVLAPHYLALYQKLLNKPD